MWGAAEGASAFWPRWRSQWSIRTRAVIASAMGVARRPTQGSWRPVVATSTGSPARSRSSSMRCASVNTPQPILGTAGHRRMTRG